MTPNIHERAKQLAASWQIPLSDAYAELSRRSAAKRRARRNYGVLHVTNTDRRAFANCEPGPRFWWNDPDR